jgi:hypothetical protein
MFAIRVLNEDQENLSIHFSRSGGGALPGDLCGAKEDAALRRCLIRSPPSGAN